MSNIVEVMPGPGAGFVHRSTVQIVVRDGRTGDIKAVRTSRNMKVYGTFNLLVSALMGSGVVSCAICGIGSGPDVVSADTALSGEQHSRTYGRLSHDANSPTWCLSFSFTDLGASVSIGQAGLLTSMTDGVLYLKASFARVTVNSQDVLNIAWTQSLASA